MKHIFTSTFIKQLVFFVVSLTEGFLLLRVALKFMGANPTTPFTSWVYDTTYSLVYPFLGMFPTGIKGVSIEIEFSTLFAMVMFAVLGYVVLYFIGIIERPKK